MLGGLRVFFSSFGFVLFRSLLPGPQTAAKGNVATTALRRERGREENRRLLLRKRIPICENKEKEEGRHTEREKALRRL